jgi:hypothetical protein
MEFTDPNQKQERHYKALRSHIARYLREHQDVDSRTLAAVCLPFALHGIANIAEGNKATYDSLVDENIKINRDIVWFDSVAARTGHHAGGEK